MFHDQLYQKIWDWLEAEETTDKVSICVDLPDIDWIKLAEISSDGELVMLRGYKWEAWSDCPIDLICRKEQIRAAKLIEIPTLELPDAMLDRLQTESA